MKLMSFFFIYGLAAFGWQIAQAEQLVSSYEPAFGKMIIEVAENGHYDIQWDRNTCAYSDFGLVAACTKKAVWTVSCEVEADKSKAAEDASYYRYRFLATPELESFRLLIRVITPEQVEFKVLSLSADQEVVRVIDLAKKAI